MKATPYYVDSKFAPYAFESLQVIDEKAADALGISLHTLLINESLKAGKKNDLRAMRLSEKATVSDSIIDGIVALSHKTVSSWHEIEHQLNTMVNDVLPTVIFVAQKVYFNQIKMSMALRDCGYKTIAIVFDENMVAHQKKYFDNLIYTDFSSFLLFINKTERPLLLHTQGWLFRYHIPVLINVYKSAHCRQIVEIMDSQSFYLPCSVLTQAAEAMQRAWGDDVFENHKLQSVCEAYIVEHADGVVFNGDDGYRDSLLSDCVGTQKKNHLSFPSWPLKDFFYSSNVTNFKTKLVFIGGIPPLTLNRPHEFFGDAQLLTVIDKLMSKGCHLDIYNNPLIAQQKDYPLFYDKFFELSDSYENFNFYLGEHPQLLGKKIANYDYGLMVYDFSGVYTGDLHFKHLIPTKLFSYLEAGLPVLVSARFEAVCEIVLKYNIGLVINENEIDCIPEIISRVSVQDLKRNVLKAREQIQMHNNIHDLIGLYERVIG